jgi:hypothetical protein
MSLTYCCRKAARILSRLDPGRRDVLEVLCRQIQTAERRLNAAAAQRLKGCLEECRGLCCRNLQLDAVFGVPDFVYLLAAEPALEAAITRCLRHENPFFTSNCPFLENGAGPCIFPPDVRPEVCITSFCRGDEALRREIRQVKTCFWKLGVLVNIGRVPFVHRLLARDG